MRGAFKRIEVGRRGGEQARRRVGSLKLLQDLHNRQTALWIRLRSGFFYDSPRKVPQLTNPSLMTCCFYEAQALWFAVCKKAGVRNEIEIRHCTGCSKNRPLRCSEWRAWRTSTRGHCCVSADRDPGDAPTARSDISMSVTMSRP